MRLDVSHSWKSSRNHKYDSSDTWNRVGMVSPASEILTVTSQTIPGYNVVKVLGIVQGMTARTRGIGGKLWGGIQSMVGGEVTAFTQEIMKAKVETLERLKMDAQRLGANAVVAVDFETTEVFQTVVLVSAYGTAVLVERQA